MKHKNKINKTNPGGGTTPLFFSFFCCFICYALVPQSAAAASKVLLLRFGFHVLSFRTWSYHVYVVVLFRFVCHRRSPRWSRGNPRMLLSCWSVSSNPAVLRRTIYLQERKMDQLLSVKALVGWATGKRLTDRLLKLRLTTCARFHVSYTIL